MYVSPTETLSMLFILSANPEDLRNTSTVQDRCPGLPVSKRLDNVVLGR